MSYNVLPGDGSVPEDIRQHRFQLGEELGRILLTRWTRKDIEDRLYWDEPYWSRALIGTGALMLGTWDGLTALWESLKSLLKLGVIVAEVAWDVVVFHVKLGANIAQGDIDAAVADLKRVGLKGIETLQDIKELVMQGKAMLDLLMEDQHSRRMLANYLIGWTDSVGDVALMRGAVATTVEIGLEVLIAIASLGAGAAVAAGSIARRIGPFTARALELIAELARMLRNIARRAKTRKTPDNRPVSPNAGDQPSAPPKLPPPAPHPGLHNQAWDDVEVEKFKTRRAVDMENLTAEEKLAVRQLKEQGRKEEQIEQLLSSADGFRANTLEPGDKLYGFDSQSNPYGTKNRQSMYWLDEAGYQDVKQRYFKDGAWDREGVKNYLALPCYNRADVIDTAIVERSHTAVESTIGTATEQLSYSRDGYSTGMIGKIMPGGGTQITPDSSAISAVSRLTGTPE